MAAVEALATALRDKTATVVWLADGIDHDGQTRRFAERLQELAGGGFSIVDTRPGVEALATSAGVAAEGRLEAQVLRAEGGSRAGVAARGVGTRPAARRDGLHAWRRRDARARHLRSAARAQEPGDARRDCRRALGRRGQPARCALAVAPGRHPGRAPRAKQAQPLLAPLYYIERALAPFSEIAKSEDANLASAIDGLIKRNISVLMLADIGTLPGEIKERVAEWVKKGGVLVRFAGPRLEKGGDELLPASLRFGTRTLGSAMSWPQPQQLAAFADDSLFAGLPPSADVLVNSQVLADPAALGPDVKVWARLKDGTPLVTAAKRGDGQLVFFHVTANSDWSNLPLSGLFVEMLRRIASLGNLSGGVDQLTGDAKDADAAASANVLAPLQVLDGFGLLKSPSPTTQAISAAKILDAKPSAENPPGYYGPAGAPRALNLMTQKSLIKPMPSLPSGVDRRVYESDTARPLKPQLLTIALMLLFVDILAVRAAAERRRHVRPPPRPGRRRRHRRAGARRVGLHARPGPPARRQRQPGRAPRTRAPSRPPAR